MNAGISFFCPFFTRFHTESCTNNISEKLDLKITFNQAEILMETYYPDSASSLKEYSLKPLF
jgi:hypothetical protein